MSTCAAGIDLGQLVELDDALEEHVFGCAACTERLTWLAALARAVPPVVEHHGGLRLALTRETVERMERGGVVLRHYHFDDTRSINCTVGRDDHFVVSWIPVTVAAGESITATMVAPDGTIFAADDDLPFDHARGELVIAAPAASLRLLPDILLRLHLHAVGPAGTRSLGEYLYNHQAPRHEPTLDRR